MFTLGISVHYNFYKMTVDYNNICSLALFQEISTMMLISLESKEHLLMSFRLVDYVISFF